MSKPLQDDTLEKTRAFWNASPCGAQDSLRERIAHRYAVEPWVKDVLERIAPLHPNVVEIGCGQGTDGLTLCTLLPGGGTYLGIDYSDDSVKAAERARREAEGFLHFNVDPVFRRMNAEQLEFPSNSLPFVYSNGVLHHTARPRAAYAELSRVVQPGGEAVIALYRKPSLKVGLAKGLRGVQSAIDAVLGTDRCMYQLIAARRSPNLLGTMLLEGFGVPMMDWYSEADIREMFGEWDILKLDAVGCNFPRRNPRSRGWTRLGYMWLIHLRKPRGATSGRLI